MWCISQFQLRTAPPPPPLRFCGICPPCQSREWGISKFCASLGPGICQHRGHSRAFDRHAVSYPNITTHKAEDFTGKTSRLAHLSRTGKNCRGLLRHILDFMHAFLHYQARITKRNRELLTWINVQTSVDFIWRTCFHIYKTIQNR